MVAVPALTVMIAHGISILMDVEGDAYKVM